MPQDECVDCEAHYPGGKGLIQGRCRSCRAAFLARRRQATPRPDKPRGKGKEN